MNFWIDLAVCGSRKTGKALCGNLYRQIVWGNTYLWQIKLVCTLAKITWLLSGSESIKHLIMLLYLSTRCLTWMWGANLEGKWRREFQFIIIIKNELNSLSFFSKANLCKFSWYHSLHDLLCLTETLENFSEDQNGGLPCLASFVSPLGSIGFRTFTMPFIFSISCCLEFAFLWILWKTGITLTSL